MISPALPWGRHFLLPGLEHRHDRPAAVSVRRLLVVLRRLHGVRSARACARPGRISPRRARGHRARSCDVERGVGAARTRLQLLLIPLHAVAPAAGACPRRPRPRHAGPRFRARVARGLRRRESVGRRQHLRVRRRVLVLRGAGQIPAPRAILRHPGRAVWRADPVRRAGDPDGHGQPVRHPPGSRSCSCRRSRSTRNAIQ